MISIEYIIGFSMGIINVFKNVIPKRWVNLVPFVALIFCIVLNVINAQLFGGNALEAGKQAFITGGIVNAIFTGGNLIGKSVNNK